MKLSDWFEVIIQITILGAIFVIMSAAYHDLLSKWPWRKSRQLTENESTLAQVIVCRAEQMLRRDPSGFHFAVRDVRIPNGTDLRALREGIAKTCAIEANKMCLLSVAEEGQNKVTFTFKRHTL